MKTMNVNHRGPDHRTRKTWFRARRREHDPRGARPEGSQFCGTGWIAQPVRVPDSLQRLASIERAAAASRSGDPMLVLNMSIFNSGRSWHRIFNPAPLRQNIWC